MPGRATTFYRGWEIYEQGIYDISINVRDHWREISTVLFLENAVWV